MRRVRMGAGSFLEPVCYLTEEGEAQAKRAARHLNEEIIRKPLMGTIEIFATDQESFETAKVLRRELGRDVRYADKYVKVSHIHVLISEFMGRIKHATDELELVHYLFVTSASQYTEVMHDFLGIKSDPRLPLRLMPAFGALTVFDIIHVFPDDEEGIRIRMEVHQIMATPRPARA